MNKILVNNKNTCNTILLMADKVLLNNDSTKDQIENAIKLLNLIQPNTNEMKCKISAKIQEYSKY